MASSPEVLRSYGQMPLIFEKNEGQTDPRVQFVARTGGATVFLTGTEAVMALRKNGPHPSSDAVASKGRLSSKGRRSSGFGEQSVIRIQTLHSNPFARAEGVERLPGISNYFIGSDPAKWHTNIPQFGKVRYHDVYDGIDMVYYGDGRNLEYDFVVAPGADPSAIRLGFEGVDRMYVASNGDLVLQIGERQVRQRKPVFYQEMGGKRYKVAGNYKIFAENREAGIVVPQYDRTRALVVDPVLVYATYLGGSDLDTALALAVDSGGNVYVHGDTASADFPTLPTSYPSSSLGFLDVDVFITKIDSTGTRLLYSTYIGGSELDLAHGIAVDTAGNAYITGETESVGAASQKFPLWNPLPNLTTVTTTNTAYVTELNSQGSALIFSTYLGGSTSDSGRGVALDPNNGIYIAGLTASSDFPTTPGAFQRTFGGNGQPDFFVTKLNPSGAGIAYSTYLGGEGTEYSPKLRVDTGGNAYIAGYTASKHYPTTAGVVQGSLNGNSDAVVTKLNSTGTGLVYSTYLGGSGDEGMAQIKSVPGYNQDLGLGVDSQGNVFVAGNTQSPDFPGVTASVFQPTNKGLQGGNFFVSKLNPAATGVVFSTFVGGSVADMASGVAIDVFGNAYITGSTHSSDFPSVNATQQYGGGWDGFVVKLKGDGTKLLFATYFGGTGDDFASDIVLDAVGGIYFCGTTSPGNLPPAQATPFQYGGGSSDAFVAKLSGANVTITMSTSAGSTPGSRIIHAVIKNLGPDTADKYFLDVKPDPPPCANIPPTCSSSNSGLPATCSGDGQSGIKAQLPDLNANASTQIDIPATATSGNNCNANGSGGSETNNPGGDDGGTTTAPLNPGTAITVDTVLSGSSQDLGITVTQDQDGGSPSPTAYTWAPGTPHTLSVPQQAIPAANNGTTYAFLNWEDNTTSPSRTIPSAPSMPTTYTATYKVSQYLLQYVTIGGGTVTGAQAGTYVNAGTSVTLTAIPSLGNNFSKWTDDLHGSGNTLGTATTLTFSMNSPKTVTAVFVPSLPVATMISPTPGTTLPSTSVTFSWNAATNAAQYWLNVGNAPGTGEYTTGALTATSKTVSGLPCDGRTLYASLFTMFNGAADYVRPPQPYTYTACSSGPPPATIFSPAPGTTLPGTSVTFSWNAATNAAQYWLNVGNAPGTGEYTTGALTATSKTVSGLPCDGRTLYASLFTMFNGAADYTRPPQQYTYAACSSGPPPATIFSPAPGTTLPGTSVTFSWNAATNAAQYWLNVGNGPSTGEYATGALTATSKTVSGLPCDGRTLYVSLYTMFNGAADYTRPPQQYTYAACSSGPIVATMTSPTPNTTLTSTSVTFSWTSPPNAARYWLDVGNGPLMGDYATGVVTTTFKTVSGLPCDGRKLYVSLYSMFNGAFDYTRPPQQYTYTACSSGSIVATMSSPTPGTLLPGITVTFFWNPGTNAARYWLDVGNAPLTGEYTTGALTATSKTVSGLPCDGRTLYASLYTMFNGAADYTRPPQQYTYTAPSLFSCGIVIVVPGNAQSPPLPGAAAQF